MIHTYTHDMMKGRETSLLDVVGLKIGVAGKMGMVGAIQRAVMGCTCLPSP